MNQLTSTSPASGQAFEVQEKLAQLEAALLAGTPNMPTLLQSIHKQLKNDPAIVTLLSDEECAMMVQGLKKQTATSIATTAVKKKGGKAISKLSLGDL